jgi:hypothetical protein
MGFIFYLGAKYQIRLDEKASTTYDLMPVLLFATIYPIGIGLLLRLPKLIIEIKEKKQWTFDWIKVVSIGVPALYIASAPILATTGINFLFVKGLMLMGSFTLITVAGIVFGYVLLDSLKK